MDVETSCSTPGCSRPAAVGPAVGARCLPCAIGHSGHPAHPHALSPIKMPQVSSAEREVEMFRRNIKDLIGALEGKTIVDATFVVRYLKGLLPWDDR